MAERTVYVGNVDAEVDEPTLRAVFENCGFVSQVRIAGKPGFNTVYCFIEFAEPGQAALALAMDGLQLGERQIKVSMAKIPPRQEQAHRIGLREKPRIPPVNLLQAQAQARLLSLQPAFSLLQPLQQTLAASRPLLATSQPLPRIQRVERPMRPVQDPDKVERTIYIENVAEDVDEQVLADHFGVCGEVTAVRIAGNAPDYKKAWVEFDKARQARSAQEYDQTGLGSSIIRVKPSRTAIHTNGLMGLRHQPRTPSSNSQDGQPGPSGNYANGHARHRQGNGVQREDEFSSPSDRRRFQHSPNNSPEYRRSNNFDNGYDRDMKRMRVG